MFVRDHHLLSRCFHLGIHNNSDSLRGVFGVVTGADTVLKQGGCAVGGGLARSSRPFNANAGRRLSWGNGKGTGDDRMNIGLQQYRRLLGKNFGIFSKQGCLSAVGTDNCAGCG